MKRNSSKPKRRYGDAGFTLVELVVVIAVLAILAGVGAVAYNGYIDYANKGNDRALVGEIIHALELADYSNPDLIPDGEPAIVYITGNGSEALSMNNAGALTSAMEDAFGDLNTVKLAYTKWGGIDAAALSDLASKISGAGSSAKTYITDYLDNGGVASFAGNIPGYWSDVETLIQLQNATGGKDDYLATLVSFVTNDANKANFLEALSGDTSKWGTVVDVANQAQFGALIAGNYAFASWVESKHPEALSNSYISDTIASFKVRPGTRPTLTLYSNLVSENEDFKKLVEEYQRTPEGGESQARIDAKAFLGLMEAGAMYLPTDPGAELPKDTDFTAQMDKVVTTASGVLAKNTTIANLSEIAELAGSGSVITVTAEKKNGILSFDVNPDDADPGLQNQSAGGGGEVETPTCNQKHDTNLTVVAVANGAVLSMTTSNGNIQDSDNTIYLCSILKTPETITIPEKITATFTCSDGSVTWNPDTKTLTPVKSGTATLSFSHENGGSLTCTISVH